MIFYTIKNGIFSTHHISVPVREITGVSNREEVAEASWMGKPFGDDTHYMIMTFAGGTEATLHVEYTDHDDEKGRLSARTRFLTARRAIERDLVSAGWGRDPLADSISRLVDKLPSP